MTVMAMFSFFINELNLRGPLSPMHLIRTFTLVTFLLAKLAARASKIKRRKWIMLSLYLFALLQTGAFTF